MKRKDYYRMNLESVGDSTAAEDGAATEDRLALLLDRARTLRFTDGRQSLALAREALAEAERLGRAEEAARAHLLIAGALLAQMDATTAYTHLQQAQTLAERLRIPALSAAVYRRLGAYYRLTARYPIAMEYLARGMALCSPDTPAEHTVDILTEIAVVCAQVSDFGTAVDYYNRAFAMAGALGDRRRTGLLHSYIGNLYYRAHRYHDALNHYLEGAAVAEALGMKDILQISVHGIGTVQYGIGDYTKALEYQFRSLQLSRELGNRLNETNCYSNIGAIHFVLHNYPDALKYYLKALHLRRTLQDTAGETGTLYSIGRLYEELGDVEQTCRYYRDALAISKGIGDRHGAASQLYSLGRVLYDQGNLDDALVCLNESYDFFRALELEGRVFHEDFPGLLSLTADLHDRLGNTALSKKFREKSRTLSAALERERRHREIREATTQYELRRILDSTRTILPSFDFTAEVLTKASQPQAPAPAPGAEHAGKGIAVTTFGRFAVCVDGRELTNDDWKRKKSRDVFKLLLLNHRRPMAADQIIDILWPDTPAKNVRNLLWNAVSAIRLALEPGIGKKTPSSYLRADHGCYTLDLGGNAGIDFLEFKSCIARAQACSGGERIALLAQAVGLYTGEFLREDAFGEWSAYERESLKEAYLEALGELAHHAADSGDTDQALGYARRMLEADRLHDDAYELMLTIFVDNGQAAEAHKLMEHCAKAYDKELGARPPRRLAALLGALQPA